MLQFKSLSLVYHFRFCRRNCLCVCTQWPREPADHSKPGL